MEGAEAEEKTAKSGASGLVLTEVLPKCGLVYSEKGNFSEVLCKPKIMPIKSAYRQKLDQLIDKATEGPEEKQS